ncbi:MAG: membrane protein insertion efficiency factor YidD [Puniceicoccales bacterium]|nr:membrane protein insertion efficiency factor YidD [Puniceicoccales bacterium]
MVDKISLTRPTYCPRIYAIIGKEMLLNYEKFFDKIFKFIAVMLIALYQNILSPLKITLFGQSARCRFYPTCSNFAQSMFGRYAFLKALYFSMRRILRCNPFWKRKGCGKKTNKSLL